MTRPIASRRRAATKRWPRSGSGCPPRTRFLGYGHRVSFGYVSGEVLVGPEREEGCGAGGGGRGGLEPTGLSCRRTSFMSSRAAGSRRSSLRRCWRRNWSGARRRAARGVAGGSGGGHCVAARVLRGARRPFAATHAVVGSRNSTAWTVVYEADPRFQLSCLNRFIYVKGVEGFDGGAAERRERSGQGLDGWPGRAGRQGAGAGDGAGALGRVAGLSAWARCRTRR